MLHLHLQGQSKQLHEHQIRDSVKVTAYIMEVLLRSEITTDHGTKYYYLESLYKYHVHKYSLETLN